MNDNINPCSVCLRPDPGMMWDQAQTRFRVSCSCGNGCDYVPKRQDAARIWNEENPLKYNPCKECRWPYQLASFIARKGWYVMCKNGNCYSSPEGFCETESQAVQKWNSENPADQPLADKPPDQTAMDHSKVWSDIINRLTADLVAEAERQFATKDARIKELEDQLKQFTPNAGEKCPVCGDKGCVETGEETPYETPIETPCPACNRNKASTALKPAVESPAAEVKEREVSIPIVIEEPQSDRATQWGISFAGIYPTDDMYIPCRNKELAFQLQELINRLLTTKLAALQVENQGLKNNLTYRGACDVCWTSSFEPLDPKDYDENNIAHHKTKAGEPVECTQCKLRESYIKLHAENQGLIKEVERLREALKYYADDVTHKGAEYGHQWIKPVDIDLGDKAKKALGVA